MRGYSSKMLQIPCKFIIAFPKCGKYHAKCTVLSANSYAMHNERFKLQNAVYTTQT